MSTVGFPSGAAPDAPVVKRRASGWLTVFSVTAIGLGAIQAFAAASRLATPAMLDIQQRVLAPNPDVDPAAQAQVLLTRATLEVYARYRTVVLLGAATQVPVGVALIVGGVACLSLRRWGRRLLVGAFTACLAVELALARPFYALQRDVMAVNEEFFERSMRAVSRAGAGADQVAKAMGSFLKVGGSAGRIGLVLMSVVSAAACAAGALYLLHPRTRARFEEGAPRAS